MTSLPNLLRTRIAAFTCSILLPLAAAPRLHCQGGAGAPPSAVQPGALSFPHPRLRLAPAGPLTLSPDSFPRRLYLRNLSPEPLSVSVRFHEAEPDTASPAVVASPDTLFLAPGASASVTLDLRLARLRRLPYAGYVYVGARGEETGAAVDVTLVRRVKPASPSPPWIARWRTELRRHVVLGGGCERFRLLGTCTRGGVLPLAPGEGGVAAAPPVGTVLGFVSDSAGRGAALVSSAGAAPFHGGVEGVRLAFDGLDRVGRYTGEVAPGGTGGARRVSLTVLVTHGALFPVLAMLAGIAFASPLGSGVRGRRPSGRRFDALVVGGRSAASAPTRPPWTRSLGRLASPVVLGTAALVVLNERYVAAAAFGTARDYLSVFLWGVGIRAGLEAAKTLAGSLLDRVPTLGSGGG